ncbi:MAG: winged helix DNA-binding protein [Bacteroidetes Order II. Incertae sedis bacterium]|nr:winged helix DNA-binding protein [Bacteroidetes Order II. bacterium]
MSLELSPLQHELVVEFGNIYENYGFQRIKGLIVGLLLGQPEPMSLDDIVDALGRSKGPISTAVRELSTMGILRKVTGPENRRDYYTTHPDLFFNNFMFNMQTVRRNRRIAEQFLNEVSPDAPGNGHLTRNLEHMRAFYTLMETFYRNFSEEWKSQKPLSNRHEEERF